MEENNIRKELKLKLLITECEVKRFHKNSIFCYFDKNSKKNIDKKIEVLTRLLNDELLLDEEYYSKEVFEKLPDNPKEYVY